jgi:hypothetical protein
MDGLMDGWLDGHMSKRWKFQFSVLMTLPSHLLDVGPELYQSVLKQDLVVILNCPYTISSVELSVLLL